MKSNYGTPIGVGVGFVEPDVNLDIDGAYAILSPRKARRLARKLLKAADVADDRRQER